MTGLRLSPVTTSKPSPLLDWPRMAHSVSPFVHEGSAHKHVLKSTEAENLTMVIPRFTRSTTPSPSSAPGSPVEPKKPGTRPSQIGASSSGTSAGNCDPSDTAKAADLPAPPLPPPPNPPALANVWFLRKRATHISTALLNTPQPSSALALGNVSGNLSGPRDPISGRLLSGSGCSSLPPDDELEFERRGSDNFLRFHPMFECIRAESQFAPDMRKATAFPSGAANPATQQLWVEKKDGISSDAEQRTPATRQSGCLMRVLDRLQENSDSYKVWDWEEVAENVTGSRLGMYNRLPHGARKIDYCSMIRTVTSLYKELLETSEQNQKKLNRLKEWSHDKDRQQKPDNSGRFFERRFSDEMKELDDIAVPDFLATGALKYADSRAMKKTPQAAQKGVQPHRKAATLAPPVQTQKKLR
uniref:TBP-binding protein ABT1, putative n=1 Tax=Neospora caninum (strain Liverpool) TaxID=572307 RepID=A0A0F7U4B4_NEOCL|nr:TPA: TBP-binding protein ABT1, putative [Neospora caninum Liverpool]